MKKKKGERSLNLKVASLQVILSDFVWEIEEKPHMPNDFFLAENDALLMPFLSAEAEVDAENCLNRLFEETVIPQIRTGLASYLTLSIDEKDEIQSDAQTRVLGKLRKLRERVWLKTRLTTPIRNFSAYVSTITFNCRKDFILRKKPVWRHTNHRLKRLQEETDGDWEFFTDDDDNKFVGLKGKSKERSKIEFEEIVSRVREKYPNHLFLKIQELVPIILEIADGALTKNALIKAILEVTETTQFEEIELPEEMSEYLNHNQDEYLLAERKERYLHIIWAEIRTFPAHLRKVWLLSLKESRKTEAVSLLLKKRIATIKEIADALEVSLEEFSEIFARLPMSSREIADFLDIKNKGKTSKEQRVDSLRSIARNLLRRRLGIKK